MQSNVACCVQCTVYSVWGVVCRVQFNVACSVQFLVYSVWRAVCRVQSTGCGMLCAVYNVLCVVC